MPILSKSAGTVIAVWGKAFYHLPNGKLVEVKVGDHIKGGEAILTSQDGIVKITLDDGPNLLLKAKLAAADTDKVITGLNNDDLDFSTAAGLQGGGNGGLLPGLRVDRVSESVTGQEYQYSTERGAPTAPLASAEQPLYPAEVVPEPLPVPESAPVLRVLSEPAVEGDPAVFFVQLNKPVQEVIQVSLTLRDGRDPGTSATKGVDYVDRIEYLNPVTGQWEAYVPGSSLSLVSQPGDTEGPTIQVRVLTIDDGTKEPVENFILNAHVTSGTVQNRDELGNPDASNENSLIDNEGPDLTARLDPASDSGTQGDGVTNDATPTISGTGDPGTAIKVVIPGTGEELTTTVQDDGTWSVTPTVSIPDGTKGDVQVTGTDPKGDTTTATVPLRIDTGVPNNGAAPTVTIVEDANNDGFINRAESNGDVDVKVAFTPAQVSVGDVVKVTSGGVTKDVIIAAADQANGYITTSFSAPANGTAMTVTAHIEDPAGNVSDPGADTAKLDLNTLGGLSVSITTDANNDGFINKNELAGSQTAEAQVKLPADAVAGDLLTLTSTGSPPQTITLTQAQVDARQVLVNVAVPASGTDLVVTAQVSDVAGNLSAVVSDHAVISTNDISAPKVTIGEDANNDGFINQAELNGGIEVSVGLPAAAQAGDSLLVVVNGTPQTPIVLTPADITAGSVSVPGVNNPGEGATLTVTAQVKDVAGNLGAMGSDSAVIDSTPPTVLTAQLDPASDSGTQGDGITNDATPTISGTGDPGAQIKVTLPGSTEVLTTIVGNDGTWQVTPTQSLPNGTTGQAEVTETDAAGNTTQTKVPLTIDTGVPNGGNAPIVTITEDANNDGFINRAELSGDVDVKVAFATAQVSVGDVVKVTSGTVTQDVAITETDRANGFVTTSFAAPANGTTLTVTAHIEDKAGNASDPGTDSAKLDLSTLGGLNITLSTDANNDGFINKAELGAGNQVSALVKLPVDAVPGDALSITATGNATQTIILTQAQVQAGQVPVSLSAPASGTDLVVSAQVKDAAGNQSNVASDHAIIATDDISAPKVTITTDANNDGFINKTELGAGSPIGVQIDLPGTAKAGDSLLVNVNGTAQPPILLTQADIDNHGVTIPGVNSPGDGNPLSITAQIKDVAGNLGAPGSDSAKIDTTNYTGLGISITTDGNNDGYISKAELTDNTIGVRVALPAGAAVGDTLTVTGSGNVAQVITLTAPQLADGFVALKFNPTGDNTDFVSTAHIVDAAGNAANPVSDAARLQLGAPGAPIVTISEDANNDGSINQTELSGNVDVSVALPATAKAGDSLLVSANGAAPTPILLTQADIDKGSVSVPNIASPGEGNTLTVTAQVKDVAGNLGATGSDSAKIDTTAPTVLTAQLDPASDSGTKGDGITNDATPAISGTGEPGAQVKVTWPGTGEVLTTTVQSNGTWTVTPTQDIPNGTTGLAQVTETDAAGNSVQTSVPLTIDTGVPNNGAAPVVTITEDANNDGYINQAELNGQVDVKVAFNGNQVNEGDVVKVTSGGVTQDVTITAPDKANGFVTTSVTAPAEGATVTVTAHIVDQAGNTSGNGSDSAILDKTPPAVLTAQLDPASDSGTQGDGITNDATPTISGTGDPGAQIKVTLPGSTEVLTTIVGNDGTWQVTPTQSLPNGTTGQAEVTETDAAGNTTQTKVPLTIDTGVPNNSTAPIVTITEDANNDGFINRAELSGNVDVKVAFATAQVSVGDVVKVTSGAVTKDVVITEADRANGFVTTSFAAPANGTTLAVTAHIEDKAGNASDPGTDSAKLDLSTLGGLNITLSTDANNDGFINKAELGAGNQVSALVKLPTDAAAGDILSITATGNAAQAITLTQAQIDAGQVQVNLSAPASGTDLVVNAQVSDPAGNQSNVASDHAIIATDDISAPKVTITTDTNNDGFINKAELGAANTVAVSVALPTTAKVGDSLLVSVNGAAPTPIVLTQAHIDSHTVAVPGIANPGEGVNLQVTAQIKDVAGNLGAPGSDSAKIDTTNYTGLGISITTDGNNDGYISKAELTDNTIGVRVALPAGAAVGDTLTVTGSGNVAQVITLTAPQLADGFVALKFNPTGDNTDFVSTAHIVDAAGNASGPVSDAARLQLGAPGAPIVTISEDANNDGSINQAELSGNVDVSVALPATAKVGDSLLVSANGAAPTPILLTQADIDKGSVSVPNIASPGEGNTLTVTAQVKDVAGNLGATGSDSAKIDTTAPTVLTAQLDPASDSGTKGDGITNDATPTISGTGEPGAQVKVTWPGTGEVLTTTVQSNGTWTVTPTQDIPNGTTGLAQVTETDAAGNSVQTSVPLTIDTGVPNNGTAPVVTITEDANNDGYINQAELNGQVDVKVAFNGNQVNEGDVVKVTSGGVTQDVTITAPDKANGFVTTSFAPAADGTTMTVTAAIVDKAGNVSAPGSDSAIIDTTPPALDLDADNSSGVTGTGYATTYTEGAAAVRLSDADISLSSSHPTVLTGATIKLANAQAGDVLSVVSPLPSGITATVGNGTVTLSGAASLADYQTAIRNLGFSSTSSNPSTVDRTVEVIVTDGSSASNTALTTVHVIAVNDAPVVGNAVGQVSEEGLPGGLKDGNGGNDNTDSATVSGKITMSDADSTITSVTLSAPTDPVMTTSGKQVVWTSDGQGGLIGKDGTGAGANTVFTVSIDKAGNYSAQLLAPLHHASAGEDVLNLSFGVTASDGAKTGQGNLTIQVQDDAPGVLGPVTDSVVTINTNLLITLDVSGSMNDVIGGTQTRLELAVASIKTLLDKYDQIGDVAVRLVTFSTNAQALGSTWLTVSAAKSLLASITANGGTNYDYALTAAENAFSTSAGKLAGAQNVGYFFSDGNPTLSSDRPNPGNNPGDTTNTSYGDGIDTLEEADWVKFLNDNQIKSYAIGLGSGVQATYLNPIAHDGQAGQNLNGTVVTNLGQLDAVLSGTVKEAAVGHLFTNGSVASEAGGADGFSHVDSITVNGQVHHYDAAHPVITLATSVGSLTLNMDTGEYTYNAPGSQGSAGLTETFSYSLADGDGDTTSSTLTIQVLPTTVQAGTTAVDTFNGTSGADILMGREGNDIMNGGAGDDRVYGNAGNDVITGGEGQDTLNGGLGNDTLSGGNGHDILVGGPGSDVLTGGAGSDTFAWHFADPGTATTSGRAVDTIKDFNVAPVADGGDVLDLRDLLQGENTTGGSGNLHNYLDFDTSTPGSTVVHVSATGGFTNGTYTAGQETQRIVLEGVNIRTDLGLATNATDDQIIVKLLQQNKLLVDG